MKYDADSKQLRHADESQHPEAQAATAESVALDPDFRQGDGEKKR
jgi:hypothetical protein